MMSSLFLSRSFITRLLWLYVLGVFIFPRVALAQSSEDFVAAVSEGEYARALEVLETSKNKSKGEYWYLFAYLKNREGKPHEALDAITKVRLKRRYFNPQLDFEEAWAFLQIGDYKNAHAAITRYLAIVPSDAIAGSILRMSRIGLAEGSHLTKSVLSSESPWTAAVSSSIGYNDNVIGLGQDQLLPSEINNEEAMFVALTGVLRYRRPWLERNSLLFSYEGSARFYEELSDFNSQFHRLLISNQTKILKNLGVEVGGEFNDYLLDTDEFRHQIRGYAETYYRPNLKNRVVLGASLSHSNFRFDPALATLDRDGEERMLYASHEFMFSERATTRFRFDFGERASAGSEFDAKFVGAEARFQYWLNFLSPYFNEGSPVLRLIGSYKSYAYDNTSIYSISGRSRNDDVARYGIAFYAPLGKLLSVYIAYFRTRNVSNISVYNYSQNQTSIGVSQRF